MIFPPWWGYSDSLLQQIHIPRSNRVEQQFAGQLQFSQATLFLGCDDFVEIFPRLGRPHFGRLFDKGNGVSRAGGNTNTASDTAVTVHHRWLIFGRNAHRSDLAAFHTDAASFARVPLNGRIKVRYPKIYRFREVLLHAQHPAAASAA